MRILPAHGDVNSSITNNAPEPFHHATRRALYAGRKGSHMTQDEFKKLIDEYVFMANDQKHDEARMNELCELIRENRVHGDTVGMTYSDGTYTIYHIRTFDGDDDFEADYCSQMADSWEINEDGSIGYCENWGAYWGYVSPEAYAEEEFGICLDELLPVPDDVYHYVHRTCPLLRLPNYLLEKLHASVTKE